MTRATTQSQIKGNDTIITRATTPSQRWQGCLHINNSNDPIVMRATITIATTAKTMHIEGNNEIVTRVMTPAQQQAMRATTLA
jgi:hypothetical protein